jgi:hypothetical protein
MVSFTMGARAFVYDQHFLVLTLQQVVPSDIEVLTWDSFSPSKSYSG